MFEYRLIHYLKVLTVIQHEVAESGRQEDEVMLDAPGSHNAELSTTEKKTERERRKKTGTAIEHTDIIKDGFWKQRPWLISKG